MNKKIAVVGLLSMLMFACSSNRAPSNNPNPDTTSADDTTQTSLYSDSSANGSDNNGMNSGNDQATNSVYYDINRYDVADQYGATVAYNANFLAAHGDAIIRVEGNTDDTGSVEYNLALGQRRADSVKKALITKGGNAAQIEATSNGKLMAKFSNDTEDGRAKNRRSDMFYTKVAPNGYHLTANELPAIN